MIRTKKGVYQNRNNTTSRIFIEVSEEINDKENNQFIFNVVDYVFDNEQKKIINSKQVIMPYANRDALKKAILKTNKIPGTESEVNKVLMPFALLYMTSTEPIYCQSNNDFELNI